jgi:hypothetical protein
MHGVMARVYNLPVKNSGLVVLGALLPLVPGAFVEPDEKKTRTKNLKILDALKLDDLDDYTRLLRNDE